MTDAPTSESSAPRPNFLVVGVAKAGTTALYHHLDAHPDVFMSEVKEPNYFVSREGRGMEDWDEYLALFAEAGDAKAIGEASPRYFHDPAAPAWTDEALPGVRIIVLLRQPVERAQSHYAMMTNNRAALTPEPFGPLFRRSVPDAERWHEGSGGVRGFALSFYADALERWLDQFGRERVAVFLHEDLRDAPSQTLRAVFDFLDVDPDVSVEGHRQYNVGRGLPRSGQVQRLIFGRSPLKRIVQRVLPETVRAWLRRMILRLNEGERHSLTADERGEFMAVYRDDVARVEQLIGRDLSRWYS